MSTQFPYASEQGITDCFRDGCGALVGVMPDFSHLFADKIAMVARYVERGHQATDEMLLEAFQQIDCAPFV